MRKPFRTFEYEGTEAQVIGTGKVVVVFGREMFAYGKRYGVHVTRFFRVGRLCFDWYAN